MTIETKFNKGQRVFLIDNDEIISLPVSDIEYKNGTITYSFIKHKSQTLMDKDTVVYRDEERCFGSIEKMVERFALKSQNKPLPMTSIEMERLIFQLKNYGLPFLSTVVGKQNSLNHDIGTMSQDIMKSKEEIEEIYGAKNLHQICYMLARDYALRCKLEYRRRNDVESRMWYELEIYDDELKDPVWIFKEDAQKFALLESRVKNRLHKLINSQIEVEKLRYQET